MTQDTWDPRQYERFGDERRAPFYDLLALVRPRPGMRAVDLGCGTGELTRILHDRLGAAETVGVDRSSAMLARGAAVAGAGVRFVEQDLREALAPARYDLVFSNAALHWVPDHPALFARIAEALAPAGQVAVQVPANSDHPAHTVAVEVAAQPPFRDAFTGDVALPGVLDPAAYALLLDRLGFRAQHVRLQVYMHRLSEPAEVVEWVKGTFLTAYKERLPAALYQRFLDTYRARLLARLGDERPYPYSFKRILLWGETHGS